MIRPVLAALLAATAIGAPALADTADKRIALSNNYAGNSWRQAMLRSWEKVTAPAVADGVVAAADAFTTAENQVTEQAAQIQNLILQGYDAIVLNAASPEGLNGAVKEACDAGHHRRLVRRHRHRALRLAHRASTSSRWARTRCSTWPRRCPRAASCSRSAASPASSSTTRSSTGIHEGVAENPQFEIVGSVHGDWAQDVAQKAVAGILPSLPETSSAW